MITLYTASTPNGWKASITLEELGRETTTSCAKCSQLTGLIHPDSSSVVQTSSSTYITYTITLSILKAVRAGVSFWSGTETRQ